MVSLKLLLEDGSRMEEYGSEHQEEPEDYESSQEM